MLLPVEIILRKRQGFALSADEIQSFVLGYTNGQIPDYQMSALLMAIYFQGMTTNETLELTKCMLRSGAILNFSHLKTFKVDKHSTGGVGDKTSLILAPIVAACGIAVPMISGRGLGHSGGTLDKLESIPGFNTQLSMHNFSDMVERMQLSFIGQTEQICPADKKIYALRDVTGTVESIPLICASIMSKKLAEGLDGIVLDVKFGSGAFMKSFDQAETLASNLISVAKGYDKKVTALLTNMNQPLGQFAGNALEVAECLSILRNEPLNRISQETRDLSISLAAHMLWLAKSEQSFEKCKQKAEASLADGSALKKFLQVVEEQGGRITELPTSRFKIPILSNEEGFIESIDCEKIGYLGVKIKAGRSKSTDVIEPTAGFEFHKKIGDTIKLKEPLITLYGSDSRILEGISPEIRECFSVSKNPPHEIQPLIKKVLT